MICYLFEYIKADLDYFSLKYNILAKILSFFQNLVFLEMKINFIMRKKFEIYTIFIFILEAIF